MYLIKSVKCTIIENHEICFTHEENRTCIHNFLIKSHGNLSIRRKNWIKLDRAVVNFCDGGEEPWGSMAVGQLHKYSVQRTESH
jgi:hypothetical protein